MTKEELSESINDINKRSWEALIQVLEDHIYNLEQYLDHKLASNHGALASFSGGIFAVRDILSQLHDIRTS